MSSKQVIKIFVSGEGGVGKTTIIDRLINNKFNPNTIMTIGVQHSVYHTKTPGGKEITLQIWDLGGEDRFKVTIPIFIKGSTGGIIAFDESRYSTFKNLPEWIKIIKKDLDPVTPLLLISTKADLLEEPSVSDEEIQKLIGEYGLKGYIRTSSKSGLNIKEIFEKLVAILEEEQKI